MSKSSNWPFLKVNNNTSLSRAEGAYLYTDTGKKILDAAGGAIVSNIGHGRKEVADAIHAATMNCTYAIPPWLTPEREALTEELLTHWLPEHLTRTHVSSGGSEGNESAIKIAVQYQVAVGRPEKNVILARSISYHGTTITTAAVSGHLSRKRGLEGILDIYPTIETPYPLRCPLGRHHPDAADYYVKSLEDTIERIGADNIAALIAEPINGSSGGAISPPDNYWNRVQAILKKNDILLIVDEVMTGFGRLGEKFGSDVYGIKPDIMVSGKGLAGGYSPITGIFSTEEISNAISAAKMGVMFHTYAGLPQSCAAASTVLKILREEQLIERVRKIGPQLKGLLEERFGQHPLVAEIRGEGLLYGIEIVKDRDTLECFPEEDNIGNKVVSHAMEAGVFFYPGGTGEVRDIVCIGSAFTIGETEMNLMADALETALNKVLASTAA
ncbi:MAG: aminotransferase class III-fold pyridoxal phosphate-dependent enzyme [Pseudomonadales bacterium]